jgi:hypothetical protein
MSPARRAASALPFVFAAAAGCGTEEWAFDDAPATVDAAAAFDAAADFDAAMDAEAADAGVTLPTGDAADAVAPCVDDTTCAPEGLHCDTTSGLCVGCVLDDQCLDDRPHCDPTLERCVQCEDDGDCNAGGVCVHNQCAASCANGMACPQGTPVCTSPHALCAGCQSDQDCANVRYGPQCDRQNGQCLPECTADRTCPSARPHCDRPINRCVRCIDDTDCPQGQSCASDSHTCANTPAPMRDQ